ncbi:lanthionine synthetase C family protein [Sinomicrobium pectinilyticum]|nr:lanthionine synthetase C family protein [Sinomicrobium pectinilyticum]
MISEIEIKKKLDDIIDVLDIYSSNYEQVGGLVGISGIAMLYLYYAEYTNNEDLYNKGIKILTEGVNKVNKGVSMPTYCMGLAGMGWVLDHLKNKQIIDNNNDELLITLDKPLNHLMMKNMDDKYYDFLHGAIGYGYYFLKRYENTKSKLLKNQYKESLLKLILMLDEISIKEGRFVKWLSTLKRDTKVKGYNLSLSHGMSSVINFLSRLHKYEEFQMHVKPMIYGGVEYIKSKMAKDMKSFSLFPNWIKDGKANENGSRLAWCYGDLGVGISFWQVSKNLQDTKLKDLSISILKHSARRVSSKDSRVIDAGICHGSFGNAQIFNRMFAETNEGIFRQAAEFWIKDGLKRAIYKDGYAGFKQWNGMKKDWQEDLSLLEGITGIGLSLLSHLSGDYSWDECLMIS